MKRILITGSEGYIGRALVNKLSEHYVLGVDIQPASSLQAPHYHYVPMDIRDNGLSALIAEHNIEQVVHLASVMNPGQDPQRDYDIDINGTQNVLDACVANGVTQLIVTSSGAAYGYHADNPAWLTEQHPLRGNTAFSYSHHKRLIESMLRDARTKHPQLRQLVLRPGTVLGQHTNNLITRLFQRPRMLKIAGSPSPFVFIWDEDVIGIICQGIEQQRDGIFNLAGDGALSIDEIAATLHKPLLTLPAGLLKVMLWIGRLFKLTPYGPEQLDFLRYRPVLDNQALKQQFGYTPRKNSQQVLEYYARHNGLLP